MSVAKQKVDKTITMPSLIDIENYINFFTFNLKKKGSTTST